MTTEMPKTVHEGRNVKRIREILGIKQETLAAELGLNQQKVSLLEQREVIDPTLLDSVAQALKVPVDSIKNFNEDATVNIIASNNNGKDNSAAVNFHCTFNPLEKMIELYERLLQAEKDKVQMLQSLLDNKK